MVESAEAGLRLYHVGMLLLQVIEGPDRGRVLPLPEGEPQLIGRSSEALPSTDTSISRRDTLS